MSNEIDDTDRVLPLFVNELVVSGFLNGVVNLTFATALFSPTGEVDEQNRPNVGLDLVVTSRLRMDLELARIVRDRLSYIIEQNTKPPRTTEH